jgi:hypothetical protein
MNNISVYFLDSKNTFPLLFSFFAYVFICWLEVVRCILWSVYIYSIQYYIYTLYIYTQSIYIYE